MAETRTAYETAERHAGGELNAAVSRAVVGIYRSHIGRGPTKCRTFFRHDAVVVLLEDVMTPAERSLAADGREEAAVALRRELQATMRADLVAAVERLTGCNVKAPMSDSNLAGNLAAEVFVLDRPVDSPADEDRIDPALVEALERAVS